NEVPRPGVPAAMSPEQAAGAPELPDPDQPGAPQEGALQEGFPPERGPQATAAEEAEPQQPSHERDDIAWPDLVLIDGGAGQLNAARETLAALGITDVAMAAIAKGPDRDAGRETFHMPGRPPFKLPPRDPVLYFVERLRDEAHRFAIGSHRQRRSP